MSAYFVALLSTDEDTPIAQECFEARDHDAACDEARRLLRGRVTDPQHQYGELHVQDGPDAGLLTRYAYVGDVELEAGR